MSEKKKPKEKKPKEITPQKRLESLIKKYFLTPFVRRVKYLLFLEKTDFSSFVLLSELEKDQDYGSPVMAMGFVTVHNEEEKALLKEWMVYFGLDKEELSMVDIATLNTACVAAKWDYTKLELAIDVESGDRVVTAQTKDGTKTYTPFHPFASLFSAIKLDRIVNIYKDHITNANDCFVFPYEVHANENIYRVTIPHATFASSPIGSLFSSSINLLAIRGLDLLDCRDFIDKEGALTAESAFRFWSPSGTSLRYLHTLSSPDVSLSVARCNMFLIPL